MINGVVLFSLPDVRSFPTLQRKLTFLEKVSGKGSLVSRNVRVHTSGLWIIVIYAYVQRDLLMIQFYKSILLPHVLPKLFGMNFLLPQGCNFCYNIPIRDRTKALHLQKKSYFTHKIPIHVQFCISFMWSVSLTRICGAHPFLSPCLVCGFSFWYLSVSTCVSITWQQHCCFCEAIGGRLLLQVD